jgi:hypothetical protein
MSSYELPLHRDVTLDDASPVPSALLNKLQDCIVGRKHGSIRWQIGGGAFNLASVTVTGGLLNQGGLWTFSGAATLYAGLAGPRYGVIEGTKITSLTWAYNRGGAGTLQLSLYKRNILTNVSTPVDVATISTGTGYETKTSLPNYTVEANHEVSLFAECNNVAHQFGGAILEIEHA